jgi:hypothetical protein
MSTATIHPARASAALVLPGTELIPICREELKPVVNPSNEPRAVLGQGRHRAHGAGERVPYEHGDDGLVLVEECGHGGSRGWLVELVARLGP